MLILSLQPNNSQAERCHIDGLQRKKGHIPKQTRKQNQQKPILMTHEKETKQFNIRVFHWLQSGFTFNGLIWKDERKLLVVNALENCMSRRLCFF